MRNISNALVLALAIIAAVVATGLIAGVQMWPWIIMYWLVLTVKNVVDYMGGRQNDLAGKDTEGA